MLWASRSKASQASEVLASQAQKRTLADVATSARSRRSTCNPAMDTCAPREAKTTLPPHCRTSSSAATRPTPPRPPETKCTELRSRLSPGEMRAGSLR
eukprot:scaffold191750_cov31-Tisochrysis_lutea.AAC.4